MKMKKNLFMAALVASILGGCSYDSYVLDSDHDETPNHEDGCPYDKLKVAPGICGCGYIDDLDSTSNKITCRGLGLVDSDGDTVPDIYDLCPQNSSMFEPSDECGCDYVDYKSSTQSDSYVCKPYVDSDNDKIIDDLDGCKYDPWKATEGECGCGRIDYRNEKGELQCVPAIDSDADTYPDIYDKCPTNPRKKEPGICGCNAIDFIDENGSVECIVIEDQCPDDPDKLEPGVCGCGVSDVDLNPRDLVPDCLQKDEGNDSDGDGKNDNDDVCPFNPLIAEKADIVSSDDEYKCSYYIDKDSGKESFVVASSEDISLLRSFLMNRMEESEMTSRPEAPVPRDEGISLDEIRKNRLTILLTNDINIDVLFDMGEWGNIINNWEPLPPAFNIEIKGSKIGTDLPIRITASHDGERAPLGSPLFVLLDFSKVSNIILDFDVEGSMAAALAGALFMTELDRVTFSGSIMKLEDSEDDYYRIIDKYMDTAYGEMITTFYGNVGGITTTLYDYSMNNEIQDYYMNHEDEKYTTIIENTTCSHAELYSRVHDCGGDFGSSMGCIAGSVKGNLEYVFTNEELSNTMDVLYSECQYGWVGGLFGSIEEDDTASVTLKNINSHVGLTNTLSQFGGIIGQMSSYYYDETSKLILENIYNSVDNILCNYDLDREEGDDVSPTDFYGVGCGGLIGHIESNTDVRLNQIHNDVEILDCQYLCGGMIGSVDIGAKSMLHMIDSENRVGNMMAMKYSGGLIGSLVSRESYDAGEGEFNVKNIYNQLDTYTFDDYTQNGILYGYYEGSYGYYNKVSLDNVFSIGIRTSPKVYLFGSFVQSAHDASLDNIYYYKPTDLYRIEEGVDDIPDYDEQVSHFKPYDGTTLDSVVTALNADPDIAVQWKAGSVTIGDVTIRVPKLF